MVIDAQLDPDSKLRLMSGRLNTVQCPNCGTPVAVASPLIYHDASKELLITFVPMELGIPKDQQDKIIGDLIKELTRQLPEGGFKGYFFNPRQALTMPGLVEQVLHADGVTPEMMEQSRQRARLIEQFLQAPEEQLAALVQQHDAEIDAPFLQSMGMFVQRALMDGQQEAAQTIAQVQQRIMQLSSYGQTLIQETRRQEQTVRAVQEDVVALGQTPTRADFMKLVLSYIDDEERLQALVGLVRPAFDYQFFSDLTLTIGQAPAEDRAALENLRDRLNNLTQMVDAEAEEALQEAAALLQAALQSPDPDAFLSENAPLLDDAFMAVLSANIQRAEEEKNVQASARLKQIYEKVVTVLQANMSPELTFVNQLLSAPSEAAASEILREQGKAFGPGLPGLLKAVEQSLAQRGADELVARLRALQAEAAALG
jgi:hypothetical protein